MSVLSAATNTGEMASRLLHTRSLAASCTACHSTQQANPVSTNIPYLPLSGMDKSFFITQMQAFKSGERASTVMHRHAKGLNTQEITELADYFAVQKLDKSQPLPRQKLLKTHPN